MWIPCSTVLRRRGNGKRLAHNMVPSLLFFPNSMHFGRRVAPACAVGVEDRHLHDRLDDACCCSGG